MSLGASRGGLLLGTWKPCLKFELPTEFPFLIILCRFGCTVLNDGLFGFRCEPILSPKFGFAGNGFLSDSSCELPNIDEGGRPTGVKELADEGGGPAGVVVVFVAIFVNRLP